MVIKTIRVKWFIIPVMILVLTGILIYVVSSATDDIGAALETNTLPIYATDEESMRISLTINCAWGAEDIPEILSTLEAHNVHATFFMLGVWAEKNPEMVKLIYEKGHEIGNHSYSHKLPSKSSVSQMEEEIDRCNDAIYNIIGVRPAFYRAPSGDYNDKILELAHDRGMISIQWSVDSLDWMDDKTADDIINRVTGKVRPGSIILFHNDTKHTAEVLPEVITHLQGEGYQLVPVSDLLIKGDWYIDSNGIQKKT